MRPRIHSALERTISAKNGYGPPRRVWLVDYQDSCGCDETDRFAKFATALRFAHHVADGGSRWEFVA